MESVRRSDGGLVCAAREVISVEGSLVREITQDFVTFPSCLVTLWHDQASVYDAEEEVKLSILTVSSVNGEDHGPTMVRTLSLH